MQVLVQCNHCNGSIDLKDQTSLRTVSLRGIKYDYILCPHCGARYLYLVADEALLRDLAAIDRLQKSIGRGPSAGLTHIRSARQLNHLRSKVRDRERILRREYQGEFERWGGEAQP